MKILSKSSSKFYVVLFLIILEIFVIAPPVSACTTREECDWEGNCGSVDSCQSYCTGIEVPSTVVKGTSFNAKVTMLNTGSETWASSSNHKLGSQSPQDNGIWGFGRVSLPNSVSQGSYATFNFNPTAPNTAGTYTFAWKMLQEGVMWFGGTCTKNIQVIEPPSLYASCMSVNAPSSVTAGATFSASVTMKNTGTNTWTTDSYKIGSQNPQDNIIWGLNRVLLPSSISNGNTATFNFNPKAPSYPPQGCTNVGDESEPIYKCPFEWKMLQEGVTWFGDTCKASIQVNCVNQCTSGQKRCNNGNVEYCGNLGPNAPCTSWQKWETCACGKCTVGTYGPYCQSPTYAQNNCVNDCSPFGIKRCLGLYSRESCGNYDGDCCLEWGFYDMCTTSCASGSCVSSSCTPEGVASSLPCCSGLTRCSDNMCKTSCAAPVCTPSCSGKNCGDDGCGGSCGTCSSGYTCSNGQCSANIPTYTFTPTQLNIGSIYTATVSGAAPNSDVILNCKDPNGNNCGGFSVGKTDSNGYLSGSGTITSGFAGGSYTQSVTVAGKTSNSITFTVQVCNPTSRCDSNYKYCRNSNIRNYPSCNVFDNVYDASCTSGSTLGKCCSVNSECPSGQKCSGGTCVAINCPSDLEKCTSSTSNCMQPCPQTSGTTYYCLAINGDWQWRISTSVPKCNVDVVACTTYEWPSSCFSNYVCSSGFGRCYSIGSQWKSSNEQVCMDGTSPAQYGSCSTCASFTDSYGNAKVAIQCSTTSTCTNDCKLASTICKDASTLQTCGNYDPDACYEWGNDANCQFGCNSATGQCNTDPCGNQNCNSPPSQCYQSTGTCSNGKCDYPKKSYGTGCDDGNGCTTSDYCDGAGTCISGSAKVCNEAQTSSCRSDGITRDYFSSTGTCSSSDGQCSYAKLSQDCSPYKCKNGQCCTPSLSCPAWDSVCPTSGTQTRTCTDANLCEYYPNNQVTETRTCTPDCPSVLGSCTPSTTCEQSGGIRKSDGTYACPGWYCRYPMGWVTPGDLSIGCDSQSEFCRSVQCNGNTYYCLGNQAWGSCSGSTPYCYKDSSSGKCNECDNNNVGCTSSEPYCTSNGCVRCTSDSECGGSTPYCSSSNQCVQCTANSQCTNVPATACSNNVETSYSADCSSNSCTYPSTTTNCQYGCDASTNKCRASAPKPAFSLTPTTMTLGSSWTIKVTNAAPNAQVALNCYGPYGSGNCGVGSSSFCTTDANGACSVAGSVPNDNKYVGIYTQSVTVYGATSDSVSFNILPLCPSAGTYVNWYSYAGCRSAIIGAGYSQGDASYGCVQYPNQPATACFRCLPGYYYSSAAGSCVPACPAANTGTPAYTGCQNYQPTNSVSVAASYGCQQYYGTCYQCNSGYVFENPLSTVISPPSATNCIPKCPDAGTLKDGYYFVGCRTSTPANSVTDYGYGCGVNYCYRCSSSLDIFDSTLNACCGGRGGTCCNNDKCANDILYCGASSGKCCPIGSAWNGVECREFRECTPETPPGNIGTSTDRCTTDQVCCPNQKQVGPSTYEADCVSKSTAISTY